MDARLRRSEAANAKTTQKMNASWTKESESYVNIPTAKLTIDAARPVASQPSRLPCSRATLPSFLTLPTISHTHPMIPSRIQARETSPSH